MLELTALDHSSGADRRPSGVGGTAGRVLLALMISFALLALVAAQLGFGVEWESTIAGARPATTVPGAGSGAHRAVVSADTAAPAPPPADLAALNADGPAVFWPAPVERAGSTPLEPAGSAGSAATDSFAWRPRQASAAVDLDPRLLAEHFASDFLGFPAPTIGIFQPMTDRTGVIEVRADLEGPVTRVMLHHDGATGSWSVVSATSEHIGIDQPAVDGIIDDPITVSGWAVAADGRVRLELWALGDREPLLVREFVIRDGDVPDWFEGAFGWSAIGAGSSAPGGAGALVVRIADPDSGTILEAAVVPIRFPTGGR